MYSTASMLRTMELILGLQADEPVRRGGPADVPRRSRRRPDLTPYEHVVPEVDLKAKNAGPAWGAKLSEKFDFTKEDAVDDLLFNEVIWRSVQGREFADAAAGAGGVRVSAPEEEGQGRRRLNGLIVLRGSPAGAKR